MPTYNTIAASLRLMVFTAGLLVLTAAVAFLAEQ